MVKTKNINFYSEIVGSLTKTDTVDRFHSTYVNALKDHCCNATSPQPPKLSKIVSQV